MSVEECGILPLFKKALHRTTTLTLPGSSTVGGGAISANGSEARSEGAEAEEACRLEYMRGSMMSSSSKQRCSFSCCDLRRSRRCIDAVREEVALRTGNRACPKIAKCQQRRFRKIADSRIRHRQVAHRKLIRSTRRVDATTARLHRTTKQSRRGQDRLHASDRREGDLVPAKLRPFLATVSRHIPRRELLTARDIMDVLNLFDDASKAVAFESYWRKLQDSHKRSIDLEALRICIRLLPPVEKVSNRTVGRILRHRSLRCKQ